MKTQIVKQTTQPWMAQARAQMDYQNKEHTEDCLDANDDTSPLKGKCICPKPMKTMTEKGTHTPTPLHYDTTEQLADALDWPDQRDRILCAVNAHEALVEALRLLTKEIHLNELSIRKDFSLINAHANATKALAKAEESV